MTDQMLNAALAGFGMAYIPEDLAESPILPRGISSGLLKTAVPPFRDTTSTTRAAASHHRPLHCWSMRCDNGIDAADQDGPELCHLVLEQYEFARVAMLCYSVTTDSER